MRGRRGREGGGPGDHCFSRPFFPFFCVSACKKKRVKTRARHAMHAQTRETSSASPRHFRASNLQLIEPFLERELDVGVMQQLLREGATALLLGQPRGIELRGALDNGSDLEILG
jgi:hypothetical protein